MFQIIERFKKSSLREKLYKLCFWFIFIYILLRVYKYYSQIPVDKTVIIDVRTKTEWDMGHHPDAIHIPYERISEYRNDNKEQHIILYCVSGRRANIAKQKLEEMGYKKITVKTVETVRYL